MRLRSARPWCLLSSYVMDCMVMYTQRDRQVVLCDNRRGCVLRPSRHKAHDVGAEGVLYDPSSESRVNDAQGCCHMGPCYGIVHRTSEVDKGEPGLLVVLLEAADFTYASVLCRSIFLFRRSFLPLTHREVWRGSAE